MTLKVIEYELSICKVRSLTNFDPDNEFYFIGKTDEEISLVCRTDSVPQNTLERDDGWRAFRIEGVLDFSLVGILAEISGILSESKIGIFAVSTFNTDYILTKRNNFENALIALTEKGYTIKM